MILITSIIYLSFQSRLRLRPGKPFPFREVRSFQVCFLRPLLSSTASSGQLYSLNRWGRFQRPSSPIPATHKMAAKHLPEETDTTTPAMPASRLWISALVQSESARQPENSDSQSEGGALKRRRVAGCTCSEPLRRCRLYALGIRWGCAANELGAGKWERSMSYSSHFGFKDLRNMGGPPYPAEARRDCWLRWGLVNGEVLPGQGGTWGRGFSAAWSGRGVRRAGNSASPAWRAERSFRLSRAAWKALAELM